MGPTDSRNLATAAAGGVVLAYGATLGLLFGKGWIIDAGAPAVTDFLPVHVAGRLALAGQGAAAYDWRAFHGIQAAFVGHDFGGFLGWHYPPLFFAMAMALALLPYAAAFALWIAATGAGFAFVAAHIAGKRFALAALALPPVLACALVGQNGFFTAALLGGMLLALPTRPYVAGLMLAALAYKPQFGVLLPFVLAAGGQWRSLGVAALLTALWTASVWLAAPDLFRAFLHYLPETSAAVLGGGSAGWYKLQSLYAVTRLLGGGDGPAWTIQIAALLAAGLFCVWLWRRPTAFALKAAALATAALLATPYIYFYDLPLLAVPLAFLARHRSFDRAEQAMTALSVLLLAGCAALPAPLGLGAILLTAAIVLRRAGRDQNSASSSSNATGSVLAASIHSTMSGSDRMVSQ